MAGGGIDNGATEKYLLGAAAARLARMIGIPGITGAPTT